LQIESRRGLTDTSWFASASIDLRFNFSLALFQLGGGNGNAGRKGISRIGGN
jgi:hypothetical protein